MVQSEIGDGDRINMEPLVQNGNMGIMSENLTNCEPIVQNGIFEHFTDDEKMFLRTEKSKPLKFLFLKFKCIIVFSVLIIAVLEFIFILIREIHASISSASHLTDALNMIFNHTFLNRNKTIL